VRIVAQQEGGSPSYLVEIDRHAPGRGRVYDRARETLHPEMLLDGIAKFGGWVEVDGSEEEREAIEREVRARMEPHAIPSPR
jgi:hypothetical protein